MELDHLFDRGFFTPPFMLFSAKPRVQNPLQLAVKWLVFSDARTEERGGSSLDLDIRIVACSIWNTSKNMLLLVPLPNH